MAILSRFGENVICCQSKGKDYLVQEPANKSKTTAFLRQSALSNFANVFFINKTTHSL